MAVQWYGVLKAYKRPTVRTLVGEMASSAGNLATSGPPCYCAIAGSTLRDCGVPQGVPGLAASLA